MTAKNWRSTGIFLNALPKSGSDFVLWTLSKSLRLPIKRISQQLWLGDAIMAEWIEEFSRGYAIAKAHVPAVRTNFFLLDRFNVRKFILHLRDPREEGGILDQESP